MLQRKPQSVVQVGAQDPELLNSPIAQEEDEDTDVVRQQVPGEPVCYFNGTGFPHGSYVASGAAVCGGATASIEVFDITESSHFIVIHERHPVVSRAGDTEAGSFLLSV